LTISSSYSIVIGSPGKMSTEPSVRITMQSSGRSLQRAIEAIALAHPYEEPIIEVTRLERRGIVAA